MPEILEPEVIDGGVDLEEEVKQKPKLLPPYAVILINDDVHSFEFVIETLMKTLRVPAEQAFKFAETTHTKGRAIVWVGQLETAEFKREQIMSRHEKRGGKSLGPLHVDIEPMD